MAGQKAKTNAEQKWRECIASMFQCNSHVVILGGFGFKEMLGGIKKYIGDKYGGDASICEDVLVLECSCNDVVNDNWDPIDITNEQIK
eukprot:10642153-Karenia_brevis.AAC.1